MKTTYDAHRSMYADRPTWAAAMGLQQVDDLRPSEYLRGLTEENARKKLTFDNIEKLLYEYHEASPEEEKEADVVSLRIAKFISETGFSFSPASFANVHRYLFDGLIRTAGNFRTENITKKEPVLFGRSVEYALFSEIPGNLDYDFAEERKKNASFADVDSFVRNAVSFCSRIWQTHPFMEGNTRSTAVFMIRYLRSKGFPVDNSLLAKYSKFFRNALVRANFADYTHGIRENPSFLRAFFDNLLLGEKNVLSNRDTICLALAPKERRETESDALGLMSGKAPFPELQ